MLRHSVLLSSPIQAPLLALSRVLPLSLDTRIMAKVDVTDAFNTQIHLVEIETLSVLRTNWGPAHGWLLGGCISAIKKCL